MRIPENEAIPGKAHRGKYNETQDGRENSSTLPGLVVPIAILPIFSESVPPADSLDA
jgi:hypothetical protein